MLNILCYASKNRDESLSFTTVCTV